MAKTKSPSVIDKTSIDKNLDDMLRGSHAIQKFRDELDAAGFRVPDDYRFRAMDKTALSIANSAVFELRGGVPAYLMWACENPTKFYELLHKVDAAPQTNVNVNGSVQIVNSMPSSDLDDTVLDGLGRVVDDDDDTDLML